MDMPLRNRLIMICVLVCALLIGPAHAAEKSVIIKLATLAPEGSSWMKTFHALNKEVMEKTNNQVQFKVYGGGVMGDEVDILRKMKIGQIQAAIEIEGASPALGVLRGRGQAQIGVIADREVETAVELPRRGQGGRAGAYLLLHRDGGG